MRNAADSNDRMPKLEMRSLDIPLHEGHSVGRRTRNSTKVMLVVAAVVVLGLGYFASSAKAGEPKCDPAQALAGSASQGQQMYCGRQQGR